MSAVLTEDGKISRLALCLVHPVGAISIVDIAREHLLLLRVEFGFFAHFLHPLRPLGIRIFCGVVKFVALGALGDVKLSSGSILISPNICSGGGRGATGQNNAKHWQ